ncbi:MAG: hypothetical protein Q8R28_01615 [Dehalococcoidia bacterium]|nr:hypothetical protein [Dehalococcoidia bacterium]
MPNDLYQPGSYYTPIPPATYVSASGEFGTPGGGPPPSYQEGLDDPNASGYIPGINSPAAAAPTAPAVPSAAYPTPYPPGTSPHSPALGPAPTADPYAAFKAAFQAAYGRPVTQRELNNPEGELNDILDGRPGLTRLLPIDRQYTLDAKVLSDLSNEDLNPVLGYILNRDPKGLLNFSADRLTQFDVPSITGFYQVMSQVDPENQLTKDLAETIQRVSGQAPTAGPPPQPGAPPVPPPGGGAGPAPGAPPTTAPPYAGAGQFAIPTATMPNLPADIASRSALEQ